MDPIEGLLVEGKLLYFSNRKVWLGLDQVGKSQELGGKVVKLDALLFLVDREKAEVLELST